LRKKEEGPLAPASVRRKGKKKGVAAQSVAPAVACAQYRKVVRVRADRKSVV
jgi:hypothetical protein